MEKNMLAGIKDILAPQRMRYKFVHHMDKSKTRIDVYDGGYLEPNEEAIKDIQDMKFGEQHAIMRVADRLFTVGDNKEGQLGLGDYELTDDMYLI